LTYKIKCIKNTRRNTNEFNQPNRTKKTNKIKGIYLANYMPGMPCNATELVHFRKRIGIKGFNLIFKISVALHGKQAQKSSEGLRLNCKTTRSSERFSSCLSKSKPTISLMGFEGLPLS
jgi:hypothetical protein